MSWFLNKTMNSNSREFSKNPISQQACTYTSLANLSQGNVAPGVAFNMGETMVPKFCPSGPGPNYPPRYDTLTHGGKNGCGGYFNFTNAYPFASCNECQGVSFAGLQNNMGPNTASNLPPTSFGKFVKRACDGDISKHC